MAEVTVKLHIGTDTVDVEIEGNPDAAAIVSKSLLEWSPTLLQTFKKEDLDSSQEIEGTAENEESEESTSESSRDTEDIGGDSEESLTLDELGTLIIDTVKPGEWYFAREIAEQIGHDAAQVATALRYRVSDRFDVDRSRKSNRYKLKKKKKIAGEMDPDELEELNQSLKRHHKQNQEINRDTVGPSKGNTGY